MTENHRCPSHTTWLPSAVSTPSAAAAAAPSTTTGKRAFAALRNLPWASWPCSVATRLSSAAYTEMALVLADEMRSLRYTSTPAPTSPIADAPSTGATLLTMAGAVDGRDTDWPENDWPGDTVSKFVPSESIWAISCARLELEIPSTATMVATPTATPPADSAVRVGRPRRPSTDCVRRSPTRSRACRPASAAPRRPLGRRIVHHAVVARGADAPVTVDHAVAQPDGTREGGGDLVV